MNWLDILLAVILLFSFAGALWNGITREVIRIIALLIGIFGGMWWYSGLVPHIAPFIGDESLASFAAFGAIVIGSLVAGGMTAWLLAKVLRWSGLRWFDRLLGGAFGLVRGLILATAIVLAVIAFSPLTGSQEVIAKSRIAPVVLNSARWMASFAPQGLRASFFDGFTRIRDTWATAKPKVPLKTDPGTGD
ncbi:MAG: CvpA family protein [Bryobacterales bacterium]|nr:CvpA family protein [Bryobacterales bacterium]